MNSASPRFSAVIPVCNAEAWLRQCLDSLLAQTEGGWEAVCVDDGSTDGSGAVLAEYAARDERTISSKLRPHTSQRTTRLPTALKSVPPSSSPSLPVPAKANPPNRLPCPRLLAQSAHRCTSAASPFTIRLRWTLASFK